ncbi:MAG: hypothetical protein WEB60_12145, partial [Terrimicrobiaceae bacterium]
MFRATLLIVLAGLLLGVVGWVAWDPTATTALEATAHLAKAQEMVRCLQSEGGLAWWSPRFLGGSPLATASGTLGTSLWVLWWSSFFGDLAGVQVAILSLVPIFGLTMFVFARRLCGNLKVATITSLVFMLSPSLWTKSSIGDLPSLCALVVLPLVCWSILRLAQAPSPLTGLLCGGFCALLAVTHSKAALLAAPGLLVFGLWALWKHRGLAAWLDGRVWGPALAAVVLLGIIPNLPSLREAGSAVLFEFGPLSGWQQTFSSKSGLHFFDRLGGVSGDFRGDFAVPNIAGATYLGVVPLLALATIAILRRRVFSGGCSDLASPFRVSAALALFCFWLSHGPFSIFSG